jgi:serine/threonine protein kinase
MSIGPGTRLGSYVVQEFIGQGAMGVVYRAYHPELERTGAVKVLQGLGGDADVVARFRREAQAIAHMRHPNVLNVFDFGEFEGTPYMIVEYVEGGSLAALTKSGPLEPDAAITFLRGIGDALDYAHKHGIVHRDVKPANVLLGPEGNPILADFGLAKLMESSSIKSLTGVTTGTPAYMAPEQVAGKMVGPAADRYSLAVMAYEMLTGELPFDAGGVLEVLYAQVHSEPQPPSMVNRKLPLRVDRVIIRGMAKDPSDRYERCRDFVDALEAALKPQTVAAAEKTVRYAPPPSPQPPQIHRSRQTRPARAPIDATTVAAIDDGAAAIPGPDPSLPAPVINWKGEIKPGRAARRSHKRLYLAIGIVLLVALAGGAIGATVAYFTQPPTMSLSTNTVRPGDTLVVMASHIPADQGGDIELSSYPQLFEFRADSLGFVTQQIVVPSDIDIGDHVVRLCWGDACYAQQVLHVTP